MEFFRCDGGSAFAGFQGTGVDCNLMSVFSKLANLRIKFCDEIPQSFMQRSVWFSRRRNSISFQKIQELDDYGGQNNFTVIILSKFEQITSFPVRRFFFPSPAAFSPSRPNAGKPPLNGANRDYRRPESRK